jgi:aspartate racemase
VGRVKTIGLLGGMSWESTLEYYRIINERVRELAGGLHSARIVLYSFDFAGIESLQHENRWEDAARELTGAARRLERASADFIVICTNTMHKVADEIQVGVSIPLLHIADAAAERIVSAGIDTVGLLGTAFTMEDDFYRGRLERRHGIRVLVPDAGDRLTVHRVIYDELCVGVIRDRSREDFLDIIGRLAARGAGGVVLGCTEIPLLMRDVDTDLPLFDTTEIHAVKAAETAVDESRS